MVCRRALALKFIIARIGNRSRSSVIDNPSELRAVFTHLSVLLESFTAARLAHTPLGASKKEVKRRELSFDELSMHNALLTFEIMLMMALKSELCFLSQLWQKSKVMKIHFVNKVEDREKEI